ncbi:DUF2083 domain-containing protein [Sphingomonas sp. AP4-R1]|uniref:helix-turn-helix domain-containing protein n=1 Tax=Sphingomonas sp. AP4-R1 TaxID=2735134 RepID=UPI0014934D43|nr:XRE family transcriptional regulator [Sphingomonas sp. AP4-R1]QJU56453.1 DUF2083 domain-containing protein [Sphingomonas sp. AP4-R1]
MAAPLDRKLYLGPRLRVLRRELGINQTQMAEELGVSPSYLNHLERNQRPLTAQMLVRLANTYDIDMRDFVAGGGEAAAGDLHAAFADGLVRDLGIPRQELNELADAHPGVAEGIGRLFRALTDLRRLPEALDRIAPAATASPVEWLRDHFQQRRNHLAELDAAAEAIAADLPDDPASLYHALKTRLADTHRIGVWIVPASVMPQALRHYDLHRRRLMIADRLTAPSRLFALAYQLCLIELEPLILEQVERAAPADTEARTLAKIAFANYAGAALLMPYARFVAAAEESRYDCGWLAARFGVSFEQLAHRLTSLDRSGTRGIPFFLLRMDAAGQVSRLVLTEAYPFARHGGVCPRWNGTTALRAPGEMVADLVESPDGGRTLILAQARAPEALRGAVSPRIVAIGCDARHMEAIVHADPLRAHAATTIGPACAFCERPDCPDRAMPPVTRSLTPSQHQRPIAPYPFRRT